MRLIPSIFLTLYLASCASSPVSESIQEQNSCKGFRIFQSGSKYGISDPKGKIFFPPIFELALAIQDYCYLRLRDASFLDFIFGSDRNLQVIVASDILNFREEPTPDGKILEVLKMGNVLNVLGFSAHKDPFNGFEYHWLEVKYGDKKGWVSSGFVSSIFGVGKDTALFLQFSPEKAEEVPVYQAIRFDLVRGKKTAAFLLNGDSFALSPDLNYIAASFGTDVVGKLTIYDTNRGKRIAENSFTLHPLVWEGNAFKFENIVYTGNGCVLWEEAKFEKGKFSRTGKKGKSSFHRFDSKADPRCDSAN